jgi:NAD(P)-dependent dehydrogenase (short-subunit alcohol dehydrogenase family)
VRAVVIGASSGLGRCIGVGLAQKGEQVAFMARRLDRLESAVEEAGNGAIAVACDVTDAASATAAIEEAATKLGGIDALVYSTGIGPLAKVEDIDVETWRRTFDTNVIGASIVTAAALPHLQAAHGRAAYLSSVSGSTTAPWPGLGAYVVSKAALERLIDQWRTEHPEIGFTRVIVGDCVGGEGDGMTGFNTDWDMDLAMELAPVWFERGLISPTQLHVDELVETVDHVLRLGSSANIPTVAVTPRNPPAS